jgi:hypothetical protein
MEWMESHPNVELVLATEFHQIFVCANSSGLQCLGAELFILIRNEMNAQREVIDERLLSAQIKDTNLCVWHTTAETRFGVRLIFAIAVAVRRKDSIKFVLKQS